MLFLSSYVRLGVAALVSASLLLTGCTTMQSVPVPRQSGEPPAVHVGDQVEVQTKQGRTLAFQVTQIETAALIGKDVRVNFRDIAGLQLKRVDKTRTGATIITVGLLTGLVILLSHGVAFMPSGPS